MPEWIQEGFHALFGDGFTVDLLDKLLNFIPTLLASIFKSVAVIICGLFTNIFNSLVDILSVAELNFFDKNYLGFNIYTASSGNVFDAGTGFLALFQHLGYFLWAIGVILAILEAGINYQNGGLMFKQFALNILKSFMSVNLFVKVPIALYTWTNSLTNSFTQNLFQYDTLYFNEAFTQNLIDRLSGETTGLSDLFAEDITNTLLVLVFLVMMVVCLISIGLQMIERGALLTIQIATGSLYMLGCPRGYDDGFWAWCKQVVAICFTAFLQRSLMVVSLIVANNAFGTSSNITGNMSDSTIIHMLLAVGIIQAARKVPEIAREFGLSAGADMTSMSSVAGTAYSAGRTAIKAVNTAMRVV